MMLITIWLFVAVAISLIYGWKINERGAYDAAATAVTLVYIPFFTYHMVMIDMTEYPLFIWIVVIAAFGSDIFAYFTGYFLGKHKMAPNLSPKKTIEGAVGGLVGSSLLAWVFGIIFMKDMALVCLLLGLFGGAAGMAGDLTASAFKRKMGIKDYGKLIPGHGGIMDRFDSVIFVAPVVYYAIVLLTGALAI
jgi:phosphatidate cytidylyltransferase